MCFVGCSKKEESSSNEQIETIELQSDIMFKLCSQTEEYIRISVDEYLDIIEEYSEFELNVHLLSLNQRFLQRKFSSVEIKVDSENYIDIINSWITAVDECGEFVEFKDEFEVDEDNLTVSAEVEFEDRDATVMFSFDENGRMKSLDVSAHYGLGEILSKAGLNTLLGMGTVFAVLIFLAFLISLLKYTDKILGLGNKVIAVVKNCAKSQNEVDSKEVVEDKENIEDKQDLSDDLELVAVITAAIAAQEGTSTDGFVVRSIRRRTSNNWS